MTTEGFAAVTCLHIAVVTDDFPEGPGSVAASFNHLVHLVFKQLVSMQSNMQSSCEFFIVLQKNKYIFKKKKKVNTRSIGHIGCFEKKKKKTKNKQTNSNQSVFIFVTLPHCEQNSFEERHKSRRFPADQSSH